MTVPQEPVNTRLNVDIGSYSIAGIKPDNEDCVGFHIPEDNHKLETKGIAVAIADGVSTAEAGREASQTAVQNFLSDYFQTPDPWSVSHAGQRILTAINLKLYRKSHEFTSEEKGYLCTFCGIVFKSHIAHLFHAGDSRIYRLRGEELNQITHDHKANIGKNQHILARAVGMDSSLQIDYAKQQIEAGDIYLLTTDGVHDFIDSDTIKHLLLELGNSADKAKKIVESALVSESNDNISCVVVKINEVPHETLDDYNQKRVRSSR